MAQMVFGRWADTLAPKREVRHFGASYNSETVTTTACGIVGPTSRTWVYKNFSFPDDKRAEVGEQRVNCKNCRRRMGWA